MKAVMTKTWMSASGIKPWPNRVVLVRLSDGSVDVAKWNGLYWSTQNGRPYRYDGGEITHYYIFERYVPSEE